MDFYFVFTGSTGLEWEVLQEARPKNLLLSYYYFRNKPLAGVIARLGYTPDKIIFDSGAFSALGKGIEINIENYMDYIKDNAEHISRYINLDVIGDAAASYDNFLTMRAAGLQPVPVLHFGDDVDVLDKYVNAGEDFIALGGTAKKRAKHDIIGWANFLYHSFPGLKYHLLGSANEEVLNGCFGLTSADASTWIMRAVKKCLPEHIPGMDREARKRRMHWQVDNLLGRYAEK